MDREKIDALRRSVRRDERYQKFKRNVEKNPNLQIPFQALHEEIDRLQRMRTIRTLSRSSTSFTADVVDAMLQDQAYRSRCTEILSSCISITGTFAETLNNLRDYLQLEYGHRIPGRPTKSERQQFMESVLRPFYKHLHSVSQLQEHARYLVEDIDKAGFTFRNLVESIKLLGRPETM